MSPRNLILAIVLGALMSAGFWAAFNLQRPVAKPTSATVLPDGPDIAAFSLLDQNAKPIDEGVFKGQWDLVFFGFTHCPDICPITLQTLSTAKRQLSESGQMPVPRIVFVSVDPERDTTDIMDAYVDAFGDDVLGITGDIEELRKFTSGIGIYFEKHDGDDGSYSVDHSAAVIVIDPDGRFHSVFGAPHAVENFVHDLPLLMGS